MWSAMSSMPCGSCRIIPACAGSTLPDRALFCGTTVSHLVCRFLTSVFDGTHVQSQIPYSVETARRKRVQCCRLCSPHLSRRSIEDVTWGRWLSVCGPQQVLLKGWTQTPAPFITPNDAALVARVRLDRYRPARSCRAPARNHHDPSSSRPGCITTVTSSCSSPPYKCVYSAANDLALRVVECSMPLHHRALRGSDRYQPIQSVFGDDSAELGVAARRASSSALSAATGQDIAVAVWTRSRSDAGCEIRRHL